LAIHDHQFAAAPAAVAFLGSWLIHISGVFVDNHELLRMHSDVPEHPELLQALRSGSLTLRVLRMAIAACIVASVLAGLYLTELGGTLVVLLGAIGLCASLSYAGGPLAYAKTGLAEPIFFVMFGVVAVFGAYFIQVTAHHGAPENLLRAIRGLPSNVFLVGLPIGALVTNVLIIDDVRDVAYDRAKGWRTGAVRFGLEQSRVRFVVLYVLAYLAPLLFFLRLGHAPFVLLPLLTLPWAWSIARTVYADTHATALGSMTPRASMLALVYAILLAIGIAISAP
jgi:1,4-dihydroxy-2-naphthoate octaprenyltransferase